MNPGKKLIGIIGAGSCDKVTSELAEQVGALIAANGYGLVCGGLGGVMAAACKGCHENGGFTLGILPGLKASEANKWVSCAVPTGMGIARNAVIVNTASVLIAISGAYGTLSEISFALQLGKPVIGLNTWQLGAPIITVQSANEAVATAVSFLK